MDGRWGLLLAQQQVFDELNLGFGLEQFFVHQLLAVGGFLLFGLEVLQALLQFGYLLVFVLQLGLQRWLILDQLLMFCKQFGVCGMGLLQLGLQRGFDLGLGIARLRQRGLVLVQLGNVRLSFLQGGLGGVGGFAGLGQVRRLRLLGLGYLLLFFKQFGGFCLRLGELGLKICLRLLGGLFGFGLGIARLRQGGLVLVHLGDLRLGFLQSGLGGAGGFAGSGQVRCLRLLGLG